MIRKFSWSKILTYADCPMKYKWKYVDGYYPKKKSLALALGSAMACGLKGFRANGLTKEAENAFLEGWAEDGKHLMLRKSEDPMRSVERGLEILNAYIAEYPSEHEHVVEPEVRFDDIEIMPNIHLTGRVDGVIRMADGSLAIIEDKTTSRLGETYFTKKKGSAQILWYLWVADLLGLFTVENQNLMPKCLINAIYIHKENFRFQRDVAIKSRQTLQLAKQNMEHWVKAILTAEELNLFPLNDLDNDQCLKYGGCEYLPLKYATGRMLDRVLASDYIKKETVEVSESEGENA